MHSDLFSSSPVHGASRRSGFSRRRRLWLKPNIEKPRERSSRNAPIPAHSPWTAGLHRCAASPVNGA